MQEKIINKNSESFFSLNRMRENPWILTTIFLVIIIVVYLFARGLALGGHTITGSAAVENLISFAEEQGIVLEDVKVKDMESFYALNFLVEGQEQNVYLTKDGKYMIQPQIALAGEDIDELANAGNNVEIPKSDKPKVEAFVFSYCPYGLQFEKALIPVYELLGKKADFEIVAIGAMHGEYEKVESLRQISIEQLYGKDKLFAYLKEFVYNTNIGSCDGEASCLEKYLPSIYTKLGLDKAKIENYMKTNAEIYYNEQGAKARSLNIGGSPTFAINGEQVQVSRTSEAIRQAVCSAFNKAPSECSGSLSSSAYSAGFGGGSGSSSSASCG